MSHGLRCWGSLCPPGLRPPSPHDCSSEVHSSPAFALGPARCSRGPVTRKQLLIKSHQVRVRTQALLLTGSEVGLHHFLNLSKIWTLFSLNFLICKMEVVSTMPADLLPKLE